MLPPNDDRIVTHGEHDEFAHEKDHEKLPLRFDQYLSDFQESIDRAQQTLLAKYENRLVDLNEATTGAKYRPAIANGLPSGYSLEEIHLIRLCCCLCVQATVTTPDGRKLVIMEHAIDQPIQYGDFPVVICRCNGKETRVIQFGSRLVGTWKADNRFVSVVGAESLEQLVELMRQLDQPIA